MPENTNTRKNKIFYLIFSIVASIALWTYVAYIGNPVLEEPVAISGIQVEFTGEELLRDYNLIVSDIDVRQLTLYFGGRRNSVLQLSNSKVRAVVDLTDVLSYTTPTGTHSLNYELVFDTSSSNVTLERASRSVIEVTVERLVTETFRVRPVYNGGIADGYMAGELTLSLNTVDIAGTESAIRKIASATVTLNRDNLSKTATEEAAIKLFDEDGAELNMEEEGLSFVNGSGSAIITQTIYMVKEVPLVIDLVECATATDANISINIEPKTITLSGDPEDLESVNNINLGTVDLKSVILSTSGVYQIIIPNNTTNLSGETTANVTIDVLGMSTRRLSASNISYRNNSTGEVSVITQSLDIVLRGSEEELAEVTQENIRIVADLSEFAGSTGTFTAPATVYVDGFPNVDAVGTYQVTVMLV